MRNIHSRAWDKTQVIDCISFINEWTVKINELNSENVFTSLCQSKTEQLNTTIADDSVCVQQCKKQDHKDHIILYELWILFEDIKTITDIFNQESTDHDWCHETKMTSQRSEQVITNIIWKINHDEVI